MDINEILLTPRETVSELDKYIVGQAEAKKAVSIALRNRWRRQKVSTLLKDEISPKNILMIGPTGVGKTEIARRLAKLSNAPFIKIEASKFTEVGYVGRDVESMVRDLVEISVKMESDQNRVSFQAKAEELAEEKILDLLVYKETKDNETRQKFRKMFREGKLNDREVEISIPIKFSPIQVMSNNPNEDIDNNVSDMLSNFFPNKEKKRKVKIKEAYKIFVDIEAENLIDKDTINENAIIRAEQLGIIFIDEIDKIARNSSASSGPDISREGVQRDMLPIIEGSTVKTKYGIIKTDHILFIGAGAFHTSKPSDLIPELQGRFPIRVELKSLDSEDFKKILTEPDNALLKQYTELLKTEGISLTFSNDAIDQIADISVEINDRNENIGARRLHTVLEKIIEDISFSAPDLKDKDVLIDSDYVNNKLKDIVKDRDLSKYIL
ncbi:MAG: ATP-dependent protease ATPase subunit HslU [Thermodesulfobacteriota bacterium]|nr:ATP-dependent protease ATPase subunit HslU [bacterium]MDA9754328.1 ATP-dependent protease ATPase subunit HslU [bacterium]MEC7925500.1 ATP-dependent protease ATPase subunit HslU [Thermodesulfobacteriota bacterium]|tara:strand:+ start:24732 stop:26048 length:1317 start_codon:yes stop_codon:yes gene_type:complete